MKYPMLWLVAKDYNRKLFSIEGKNCNDIAFTKMIYDLQNKGAPVVCETPKVSDYPTEENLINGYAKINYQYSPISILEKYR